MPCACSVPARAQEPSRTEVSTSICALKARNATPRLRLCTQRAFNLAIIFIFFISWPLLVYNAEAAEAGLESLLESHRHFRKLSADDFLHDKQKSSERLQPTFRTRKFLRQGTESGDESTNKLHLQLSDISPEGILLLPDHEHIHDSGRKSNSNRRILIPANACTNKDISISQGPDGSSGIPRYFVQIVNTCMSDCAPSQVHVFCDECTNKDISITQRRDGSPGIPRFSVQIVNTCMSDCAPADIHVYCGWFASSPPPNPNIFQRISYNDCLVNGGRPLGHSAIIQFQYANSFMYPIRFRSARFCR